MMVKGAGPTKPGILFLGMSIRLLGLCALAVALPLSMAAQTAELARKSALAKSYMESKLFENAARIYGELVQSVPGNPGLLMNHGMALHMSGADAAAIPVLQKALRINPNLPPAHLFLGASFLKTGQAAQALAPLQKFIAAQPDHPPSRQMMADAALSLGKTELAVPHLEKLAAMQPDRAAVWYELGRAYEATAFDTFQQMEKSFPESGPWFALLADSRSKTNQRRAAYFFYRKALEKSPRLRGLHASIAEIYRLTEHADWAAAEDKEEARLGQPNCKPVKTAECEFVAGRFGVALTIAKQRPTADGFYWRVRSYDALARQAFAKLAELPASSHSHRFLAERLRDQGKHAEAAAAWRQALALEPDSPELRRELAAALLGAKDYAETQKVVTELLTAEPDAPDLLNLQGDLYLAQQMAAEAIPFLERAVKANPRVLEARASLARALLLAGKGEEAVPHVAAALPLDADGSLHFQLARAHQAAGRADDARKAMAQYQAIQAKLKEQERTVDEQLQITAPAAAAAPAAK